MVIASSATAGFGNIELGDIVINGGPLSIDVTTAIQDVLIERNIAAASTVTLQITDPFRTILNSGIFQFGDVLYLDGLTFTLVEQTKTGDQEQLIFEDQSVAALRAQTGTQATSNTVDITGFAEQLVLQVPGLKFVGEPTPLSTPIQVGRGTSSNPDEDSWTCLVRIASTAGWRVWGDMGTIYFGSDPFWFSFPSQGTVQEFTQGVQNIDFQYDTGQPFGNLTVTGICNLWDFAPGSVVSVVQMGPASGNWLVNDIQRDLYSPQMTATLQVPQTPDQLINPNANSTGLNA